ncbi:MAG: hypothetical protein WCG85_14050 [Polyangia bacterium]
MRRVCLNPWLVLSLLFPTGCGRTPLDQAVFSQSGSTRTGGTASQGGGTSGAGGTANTISAKGGSSGTTLSITGQCAFPSENDGASR